MIDSTKTLVVHILNDKNQVDLQAIEFFSPTLVLDLLNANNVGISQSCGGYGTCTTCRFLTIKNPQAFSARTDLEQERAEERNFRANERLSCQTEISQSAEIQIQIGFKV